MFIQLLPSDVHSCIVREWISEGGHDNQLKVLSALDIACCSRAARQPFCILAQSISFANLQDDMHPPNKRYCTHTMIHLVQWLTDRQVAAEYLHFPESKLQDDADTCLLPLLPAVHLSSIRVLDAGGRQHDLRWMQWVLRGCPNITSISCDLPEHWAKISSTMAPSVGAHLRQLTVRQRSDNPNARVCPLLRMPSLRELRILQHPATAPLLRQIAQVGAEQLMCLALCLGSKVSLEELCHSLQVMQHLQELALRVSPSAQLIDELFVTTVLQSCVLLNAFKVDYTEVLQAAQAYAHLHPVFVFLLEAYPALRCLAVGPFLCDKPASRLQFDCSAMEQEHILRVLRAVGGSKATTLTLVDTQRYIINVEQMLAFLRDDGPAALLATDVTELRFIERPWTVFAVDLDCREFFACCAVSVLRLELSECDWNVIPLIAEHCKALQVLRVGGMSFVDDDSMEVLLAGCTELREVYLCCCTHTLTLRTLQAVLLHGKVRRFHLQYGVQGFAASDLRLFRDLVNKQVELHLLVLPAPCVTQMKK